MAFEDPPQGAQVALGDALGSEGGDTRFDQVADFIELFDLALGHRDRRAAPVYEAFEALLADEGSLALAALD